MILRFVPPLDTWKFFYSNFCQKVCLKYRFRFEQAIDILNITKFRLYVNVYDNYKINLCTFNTYFNLQYIRYPEVLYVLHR